LHRNHPKALPVTDSAKAVGSHNRTALMTKSDGSNAKVSRRINQWVTGETGKPFDPFLFQNCGDGLDPVHTCPQGLFVVMVMASVGHRRWNTAA
jgi:hypothetical protein